MTERTVTDAAKKAKVDGSTLRRWMATDEPFRAAYFEARQAAFADGMRHVQVLATKAIDTLATLLGEEKFPHVRLGAARAVLELGVHQNDAETILRKLDEIEAADQRRNKGGR